MVGRGAFDVGFTFKDRGHGVPYDAADAGRRVQQGRANNTAVNLLVFFCKGVSEEGPIAYGDQGDVEKEVTGKSADIGPEAVRGGYVSGNVFHDEAESDGRAAVFVEHRELEELKGFESVCGALEDGDGVGGGRRGGLSGHRAPSSHRTAITVMQARATNARREVFQCKRGISKGLRVLVR